MGNCQCKETAKVFCCQNTVEENGYFWLGLFSLAFPFVSAILIVAVSTNGISAKEINTSKGLEIASGVIALVATILAAVYFPRQKLQGSRLGA